MNSADLSWREFNNKIQSCDKAKMKYSTVYDIYGHLGLMTSPVRKIIS